MTPQNIMIGRSGEFLAASYLSRVFDDIYFAEASSRFDFLVVKDHINYKIQVKTTNATSLKKKDLWCRWDIAKKQTNKVSKRVYASDEVDIFAFVALMLDKVVFVPNRNLTKTFNKKVEYLELVDSLQSLNQSLEQLLLETNGTTKTRVQTRHK